MATAEICLLYRCTVLYGNPNSQPCVLLPYSVSYVGVVRCFSALCIALSLPLPDAFARRRGAPIDQAVHERADLWPEPMRFDPSRFSGALASYTFLPFIDGPRNCLGQHLSLLESKVLNPLWG